MTKNSSTPTKRIPNNIEGDVEFVETGDPPNPNEIASEEKTTHDNSTDKPEIEMRRLVGNYNDNNRSTPIGLSPGAVETVQDSNAIDLSAIPGGHRMGCLGGDSTTAGTSIALASHPNPSNDSSSGAGDVEQGSEGQPTIWAYRVVETSVRTKLAIIVLIAMVSALIGYFVGQREKTAVVVVTTAPSSKAEPSMSPDASPFVTPPSTTIVPIQSPTGIPTSTPSSSPTNTFTLLLGLLSNITKPQIFSDSSSPQYQALDWLANGDPLQLYLQDNIDWNYIMHRYVLATLYFATCEACPFRSTTNSWIHSSTTSHCEWDGVDCTGNNQVVGVRTIPSLQLSEYALNGSLPLEIGWLTSLQYLDMRNNNLGGRLPSEIGKLTALTSLSLYNNDLTGSLPTELGLLNSLTFLSLWSNDLTGTIPSELGMLTSNTYLNLYDNDLTGTLPSEIGLLTSLTRRALANNRLSGTLPTEIRNMSSIGILYLCDNEFTGDATSLLCHVDDSTSIDDDTFPGLWWSAMDQLEINCTCCTGC